MPWGWHSGGQEQFMGLKLYKQGAGKLGWHVGWHTERNIQGSGLTHREGGTIGAEDMLQWRLNMTGLMLHISASAPQRKATENLSTHSIPLRQL